MKEKDFKYYHLEDFLSNEEFKRWVLNKDPHLDSFWSRIINLYPAKEKEILKAKELLLIIHPKEYLVQDEEREQVLDNIIQKRKSGYYFNSVPLGQGQQGNQLSSKWWIKMAASLAIIALSIYYIFFHDFNAEKASVSEQTVQMINKINPAGQKLSFKLPDGSQVYLNSESSIKFPAIFEDDQRNVVLSGEAYFEVLKDNGRPFVVTTESVLTEVLGTSFNINAFPEKDEVTVSLINGKVKVITEDTVSGYLQELVLEPSEKIVVDLKTRQTRKSTFNKIAETGWKDGILVFDGDDYKTVIAKLERWYGIDVELQNKPVNNWDIKGRFKEWSLQQVLENLKYTHKVEYIINEKDVKIKFNS